MQGLPGTNSSDELDDGALGDVCGLAGGGEVCGSDNGLENWGRIEGPEVCGRDNGGFIGAVSGLVDND